MQPRQSIIEMFSTFVQFQSDHPSGWVTDLRLRRSMETCLKKMPEAENSESFWALYWFNIWHSQALSIAKEHLTAYLQEPCYWIAKKTAAAFTNNQYTLSDCFQIAITQIDKILKGFNPNHGFILKNYATATFNCVIRETLRQRHEVDICTPWGLLRKISHKRLVESLQTAGLSSDAITNYILVWNCFKTLYVPKQANATRQLSRPDNETLEAIASLYKAQSGQQIDSQTLVNWLLNSAKAARNYLYPNFTSINTPANGQESGELLDYLSNIEQDSPLSQIIAQEEQQQRFSQQGEINKVLVTVITALEPQAQKLLQLYYGKKMTQQQIAQQLEMKQYTVSRRLTKARDSLLLKLAQWSRDQLHISVTSDVLKHSITALEEWLQVYYSHPELPSYQE
jgi:RNA polymerase sigma factor (sigma-70 family)